MTHQGRPAPDFVIVGAAKAGTTSLHSYLGQHPRVSVTRPKETFYFAAPEVGRCTGVGARYAPRPLPRDAADYATRFTPSAADNVWGESCVAYLYFPEAAARIAAANPRCRIVVMLRDPVERAFSNYLHHLRDGLEPLEFRAAVAAGAERVGRGWWFGFDYTGGSLYAAQLENYRRRFASEQVHVLWYDDFCRVPLESCRTIFELVGLPTDVPLDTEAELNVSSVPRPAFRPLLASLDRLGVRLRGVMSRRKYKRFVQLVRRRVSYRPVLSDGDRAALQPLFRDDVRRLEEMVRRDLSAWLR